MAQAFRVFRPEDDTPRPVRHPGPHQVRGELKRRRARLAVRELVARYLRHCVVTGKHGPTRQRDCKRILEAFAEHFGLLAAEQIMPYMLRDWIEGNDGWAKNSTRLFVANIVKACFNWAAEDKRIRHHNLKVVDYDEGEPGAQLTDDIFFKLCRGASKNFEMALRFLRYTGRRECEACAANVGDFDLDKAEWKIWVYKGTNGKRAERPQSLQIVPEVVALLRQHWRDRGGPAPDEPAMVNTRGRRLKPHSIWDNFDQLKRRLGLADAPGTVHGMRHRHATAALINGAPAEVVAHNLGHSGVATLQKYYLHVSEETEAQRAAAKLAMPKEQ